MNMKSRIFESMRFKPDYICSTTTDFYYSMHQIMMYQVEHNQIYRKYLEGLQKKHLIPFNEFDNHEFSPSNNHCDRIPLLPIEAFRDSKVYTLGDRPHELEFLSSGTTNSIRSRHYIAYKNQYEVTIFKGFDLFYDLHDLIILAYTPGYNENPNSSLVWMLNVLINRDSTGLSRFLEVGKPLDDALIRSISAIGKKLMIFGAAFGLIEMAEKFQINLPPDSVIMETGGMKTFRKEMTREQMHESLALGFGLKMDQIHSEYGMTELLSQAYSKGDAWFRTPPWMKISIRDRLNPLKSVANGQEGLIGVIDLANWASCPFILTGDLGIKRDNDTFQVLGRASKYHLRGCNFLLEVD